MKLLLIINILDYLLRIENNINGEKQMGTKVEGAMNLGGPSGLTFTPHLGLNLNNWAEKSV